jgi:hypothetical protein
MIRQTKALYTIVVAFLVLGYAIHSRYALASGGSAARPTTQPTGVAIVELFTSQGCSSCPPAEQVLADVSRAAERDGRAVYALAFHVDYWNRLGWADPFSDAAYSQRQTQYSKAFQLDEIYTPQMVVNGQKQFVGSERDLADRAIAEALAEPPTAVVKVLVRRNADRGYHVHVMVDGAEANTVVNVAVVEEGLSTEVKAGENGGNYLEQPSVVRWFKSLPLSASKDIALPPLNGVRVDHSRIIVYAQQPGNGAVLGGTAVSLP